jgi:hypothetical protein
MVPMNRSDLTFTSEDRLFKTGTGSWRNTTFVAGTSAAVVPYASGFREAGEILVHNGIEAGMQDFIAFPALYCYRHALELSMKEVIYEWDRANKGEFEPIGTHDLKPLWSRTRAALEGAWPDGDLEQLDHMEAIVDELAAIDERGEQFRYDRDKQGYVRDLPPELVRFDLMTVSTTLNTLLAVLGGALDGIASMRDMADL